MRNTDLRLAPVLLLVAACASGDTAGSGASLASGEAGATERLTAHVSWLADDARQGRRAGTQAARDSADWLAARMAELGLEPAGEKGWMQALDVPLPVRDAGGSRVSTAARTFEGGGEIMPLFCSDGGAAEGRLAWGGYGIVHAERGWDDYAYARKTGSLEGAVVLIVRGTPPTDEPAPAPEAAATPDTALVQKGSGWGNSGSLFTKVMTAKRLGAAAVLVAQHPSQADEPLPPFDATRSAQASIPCLMVSAAVAQALEPAYERLVEELDRTGGPAAFAPATAPTVALRADVVREKGEAWNVLGLLRGRSSQRVVVVGAHYDHLGLGGEGSLAPDALGEVHNGADDNASGTAAVLEIARALGSGTELDCDVLFALWSGEEEGLLGSEHWARLPTVPLDRVVGNLNLDMVGRAGDGELSVLGVGSAAPFEAWLEVAGPRADLELTLSSSGQGMGGSDHQTFLRRQIPALHFFSGVHPDYHKPSDDTERFEAEGTARVVALCADIVRSMASAGELAFVEPKSEEPGEPAEQQQVTSGWRVWFGSVPEYAYDGKGLLLAGTSAGSPAERAGLLAGDVVVQVGEIEIENIYDYMHMLETYKPGDVVVARFLRDGVPQETRVTLATREAQ